MFSMLLGNLKRNLAYQIALALILGIVVGAFLHEVNTNPQHFLNEYYKGTVINFLKPLGDIFISLIKMIVVPIIISTLIVGIASMQDAKKLGTLGGKTIIYFEVITTIAIILGLFMANVFEPGVGINKENLHASSVSQYAETAKNIGDQAHGVVVMILDMIPTNIVGSMAKGEMLPVIFFSVFFGIALLGLPSKDKEPVLNVLKGISDTMFSVTNMIMRYAPFGVFGLIAVTISQFGFSALLPLGKLVLLVYAAMFIFCIGVLGITAYLFKFNIFTLIKLIKDELILAFSTASSEAVLPAIMQKMEAYGAPKSITGFVIPTGYSFNLDGSTLYQSIAVIFIAQMTNFELTLMQQVTIVFTLMIASKGIAGVPGVSFVVLTTVLTAMGMDIETLGFILGVDRILDMGRTAVNVVGNSLACLVIARWERVYDDEKGQRYAQKMLHGNPDKKIRPKKVKADDPVINP